MRYKEFIKENAVQATDKDVFDSLAQTLLNKIDKFNKLKKVDTKFTFYSDKPINNAFKFHENKKDGLIKIDITNNIGTYTITNNKNNISLDDIMLSCDIKNSTKNEIFDIKNLEPGKVEKRGDMWFITKKAKIDLIPKNENDFSMDFSN